MSDDIKHECGIAAIRLLKPQSHFAKKYGSPIWAFNKLFLLMEKQHNRGQDGAGIGAVKIGIHPGSRYMARLRSADDNALSEIFDSQLKAFDDKVRRGIINPADPESVRENFDYAAELLIGHLRYGTSGKYDKSACHPFWRKSTWPARNLMIVGNFNITNSGELNQRLIERGVYPACSTDTQTILDEICFHLDIEHAEIYRQLRDKGYAGEDILRMMNEHMNPVRIVRNAAKNWDGGYVVAGAIGNGDFFVLRDPRGIRPCYYLKNDEIIAFASERVALMTIFEARAEDIRELSPAHIYVVKPDGSTCEEPFTEPAERRSCTFERIYFSRGNDPEIYRERKALGAALCPKILEGINCDFKNSVFSYIPNTAETAYYGLLEGMRKFRREQVKESLLKLDAEGKLTPGALETLIMDNWPRGEKIAHKDIKLRTFISQEKDRTQLASHVYDITYGVVKPSDTLVCLDDSIVRGTTLKRQILRILGRMNPKKIIIASTAPQIRYPDCYGIDMSELGKFVAFQAAAALLKERGEGGLLKDVYRQCIAQRDKPAEETQNFVSKIYANFSDGEISEKIASLVYPQEGAWRGELQIVFQTIADLQAALPTSSGDWFFTGNYPTAGGYKVLNNAYINYYENREGRSY